MATPSRHNDDKQRVLDATDIVRLVSEHVALRARGREFEGLCPFHDDHNPSMKVVPHKQIYHCFVCGAGGDAFSFVMNFHKMEFREALEYMADRGGVKLTPWRGGGAASTEGAAGGASESPRAALLAASRSAADYFRAILAHPQHGATARAVLERRGVSPEMVERFGLGAAVEAWDGLARTAAHKKLDLAPFRSVGLIKPRGDGSDFDLLRHRVVFPIHDQIGRVIAFGGRRINDEDEPKYINSPESPLFDKSATLYGLHQGAQAIRKSGTAIVVEGYMDVIACHQAGVENAVAALGTALTPAGARVLRRLCDTVVLLFDADDAGQRAADRALEIFFAEPIDVRIAVLGGAKDPDDLLRSPGGREEFDAIIAGAVDSLDYKFSRLKQTAATLGMSGRARLVEDQLAGLVNLGLDRVSPVRREMVIERLAGLTGVSAEAVRRSMPSTRRRPMAATGAEPARPGGAAAPADTTGHILACLLHEPELALTVDPDVARPLAAALAESGPIGAAAAELLRAGLAPSLHAVLDRLADEASSRLAVSLERWIASNLPPAPDAVARHFHEHVRRLMRQREAGADSDEADTELATLTRLRDRHRRFGDDGRLCPRPAAGAGPAA